MDRIGFIGCGNMGGALAAVAAKKAGGDRVFTADLEEGKLKAHQKAHGTVPSTASHTSPIAAASSVAQAPKTTVGRRSARAWSRWMTSASSMPISTGSG